MSDTTTTVLPFGLVRCADGLVRTADGHGRVVPEWQLDRSVPVPAPDRATRVMSWAGWHFWELAGVTVPVVVAVAVTPWAWLVSGVVGAGWAVRARRIASEQAALRAELAVRRATAAEDTNPTGSGVDAADVVADGPAPDADPVAGGVA